ncbi:hypothetical protein BHE90_001840 [Fusarium euwallaceae]|uniref:Heterokaryon incompatibility domain-containing protein n=1 Tax=Fusarium euwallaceae TaxID=1147111 RepID=A0A430M6Q8_9HYPO|nr:hypothetical protein BHE90_001840 [Fusarium euwallaceae]
MSEPGLQDHRSFLRYWSFDNLDIKDADQQDSAENDEPQDQHSGPTHNFAGARDYLRFLRESDAQEHLPGDSGEPDAPEHLPGDSDGTICTRDADKSGNPYCHACSRRAKGVDRVKYFHVLPKSPLLLPAPSEDESEASCVNLHPNDQDLWAEEPNFYRALAVDGMGFLSQVAHVCLYARLSNCNNGQCKSLKEEMRHNNVPKVDAWPELTNWALTAMSCQHHHRELWGANPTSHSGHTHIASAVAALSMVLAEYDAVIQGRSTAWVFREEPELPGLIKDGEDYVAISHVWSDGTGVGDYQRDDKSSSTVNRCLWEFWQKMVGKVCGSSSSSYNGAPAIWWDTISIPRETEKRAMALKSLHRNYSRAKCTIVHDKYLAAMDPQTDPAVQCVALVLSNWFSRAWTALELKMSNRVYVIFGDTPIPLDYILAKSPATAHPVHWLATTMIKRLKTPIHDVGDILHILKARATSWARDKTLIAALLAGVPNFENTKDESAMTQDILGYLGKIPSLSLLHGEPTMTNVGPWSWCPSTLFVMPIAPSIDVESRTMSDFLSLLDITSTGELIGKWFTRSVDAHDVKTIQVFGRDNSSHLKLRLARQQWDRCHLLRPQSSVKQGEPALLVKLTRGTGSENDTSPMHCQYVSAVWEIGTPKNNNWEIRKVTIGPQDGSEIGDDQSEAHLTVREEAELPTWFEEAAGVDDWPAQGERFIAQLAKRLLGSDESLPVNPLLESILRGNPQSAEYQLESTLSRDEVDFGMIDVLKLKAEGLDATDPQLSNFIKGLWLLGDFALKFRDYSNASSAYSAAHELAQRYLVDGDSHDEDIPTHTSAMLWYQRGLVQLMERNYKDARSSLEKAVKGKLSKMTDEAIFQTTTRNGKPKIQYKETSNYMVGRDWDSEDAAWYRGALILLSMEPHLRVEEDGDALKRPEEYFLESLRHEDRDLFSGLGLRIIQFCLQKNVTDQPELPPYTFKQIKYIADALKSALEKFDTLFRKKHILCCISALCLGIASKLTAKLADDTDWGTVERRDYEALSNAQFKRVQDDLGNVLPYVEELAREDWVLYNILTSHCTEIEETVAEE